MVDSLNLFREVDNFGVFSYYKAVIRQPSGSPFPFVVYGVSVRVGTSSRSVKGSDMVQAARDV